MFWGRIHRMILVDLFKIFTLALIALTGLILLAGIIAEAMKSGLGPAQILVAAPLLLPSLLPYTVPTTTLFATCIVYGRLSADNEILALKAAGIHIIHVIWPALLLGIFAGAVTMILSLDVIPYTHFVLRTQVGGDIEELLYTMLRKDGCIRHPKMNYEIHAKSIDGRTLHDAVFKRRAAQGEGYDFVACAKEAELDVDLDQKQILVATRQCQIVQGNVRGFLDTSTVPIDLPGELVSGVPKVRSTDMTWTELAFHEAKFADEKQKLDLEIDSHQLQINRGRGEPHFGAHVRHLSNERRIRANYIDAIHCERHMRPALALGCFCFALVGCPVGIWFCKSDYLSAFVTCFLPIVVVYYPLLFCTINLARAGKMPPWLGIYDADVLTLVAGMILFRRLARN